MERSTPVCNDRHIGENCGPAAESMLHVGVMLGRPIVETLNPAQPSMIHLWMHDGQCTRYNGSWEGHVHQPLVASRCIKVCRNNGSIFMGLQRQVIQSQTLLLVGLHRELDRGNKLSRLVLSK